jgi:hypothetical protein
MQRHSGGAEGVGKLARFVAVAGEAGAVGG